MLKIVDKRSIDTHFKKFGDLEPGTVFQFRNETNPNRFYLRTKNHQTFGGMICAAIPLFGDFEETVSMYDSEVLVVEAELHILKGENDGTI